MNYCKEYAEALDYFYPDCEDYTDPKHYGRYCPPDDDKNNDRYDTDLDDDE